MKWQTILGWHLIGGLNVAGLFIAHLAWANAETLQVQATPITNEQVEAGLRKNREALRREKEFQANTALTHQRLANILSQQGDPNGAIEEYQAAILLNPRMSEAYNGLGAVYIDKHEWVHAEQVLQKGTYLAPQDHQAWFWLGRTRLAQEHFPQAEKALLQATQLEPNNPESHSDLALAFMAQGRIQEAKTALRKAIALQPDFSEAHHRLEQVRAARDDSKQLRESAQKILHTLFRRE